MSVTYLPEKKLFLLTTERSAYAFYVVDDKKLVHAYWGAKLPRPEDYPPPPPAWALSSQHSTTQSILAELPTLGGLQEVSPVIRAILPDGTRDLQLGYVDHRIKDDELLLRLKDEVYALEIGLRYRVQPDCDLIKRRVELLNKGSEPIILEDALSASVPLPHDRAGDFRLTHLAGSWGAETIIQQQTVTPGRKTVEGRQNLTGHSANPFVAIDLNATETSGEVWFAAVEWGGNWRIFVEQVHSPIKFTRLAGGELFKTPWLTLGYTGAGFGALSRNLHHYQRTRILPTAFRDTLRPVLYNSWEAVFFKVNEADQMALAEKAAKLGVELFVVDDGWFGERNHDHAGLGDWSPNPEKFPNGLSPLIERVNALGMDFGIWVEPEMVNPDSALYSAHPDWVYHFPQRPRTESRNQLVLNLAKPEVEIFIQDMLDNLLANHNISYVKWDYNRLLSEAGWSNAPEGREREFWVRHVQALYRIVAKLREKHPKVMFEACASGGGRADMGTLQYFDHVWTSDNTDPLDRLAIQLGYSLAYAPKTMYCWVTESDFNRYKYDLRYRFRSCYMGSLGVGSSLNKFNEEELAECTRYIAEYKQIREIVQHGEMYRLTPLNSSDEFLGVQYLAGGAGVVLAYGYRKNFWHNPVRLRLQGLEAERVYTLSGDLADGEPSELSGQALMSRGIMPKLGRGLDSAVIKLGLGNG
jgi:alpha-galactosidase